MVAEQAGEATLGRVARLLAAAESAAVLGRPELGAPLYPRIRAVLDSGIALHFGGTGLVAVTAGIAAAGAGNRRQAEEHFQAAIALAETLPHRLGRAEARRWYGTCLAQQDGADSPLARGLLAEAARLYSELDMPDHIRLCREAVVGAGKAASG